MRNSLIPQFLTTGLRYGRYEVLDTKDGGEALKRATRLQPEIVLLDLMMPGTTAMTVIAVGELGRAG